MTVTTDAETIVRRVYHAAEGNVMDVQGFIDLFADDGVFNAVGQQSFRGEHLGDPVVLMGKLAPDVHRELHRVNVMERRSDRALDPGHLHRVVRDARRRHSGKRRQARHPVRRLLVRRGRQDQAIRLLCELQHHA
jgi:hypothetical protein